MQILHITLATVNQNTVIKRGPVVSSKRNIPGGAGSRLAETRPGTKHCGTACAGQQIFRLLEGEKAKACHLIQFQTHFTGYLFDGHPSVAEGIVSRTVYFECSSDAKYDPISIEVLNCGDYYVYHLPNTPNCYEGFCGID